MFWLRERRERAVGTLLVLHEHEIPELEKAVAAVAHPERSRARRIRVPRPGRSRARSPGRRARATDRPEVLRGRQGDDSLQGMPDSFQNSIVDLVRSEPELRIARVDGRPDPIPVELHPLAHELGRELDCALLEVLAEREVSEHLEERQVSDRLSCRPRRCRRCESTSATVTVRMAREAPRGRGSTASAAACRRS